MKGTEMYYFIVCIVFGFIVMYMAKQRGRSQVTGFILGFLLAIWAVIGYLIAGDSQELADEKMILRETRLEQLRKKK